MREHFQRIKPSIVKPSEVLVQLLWRPNSPGRRLAGRSDIVVAVIQDVVGDALHVLANLGLLLFVGGDVVVERISKVMPVELIARRVPLPPPAAIGRSMPLASILFGIVVDGNHATRSETWDARDAF